MTVKGRFHVMKTLVNPEMHIPRNITALTGITNELVETAPVFKEVAEELHELLKDKVFVAHNVNFDYGFIRAHFADVGVKWNPKRLCTVRLSRKIIPGLYSYSLGKIAQQLCYQIEHRHRAMGDCDFTAILFKKLHAEDRNEHIKFALKRAQSGGQHYRLTFRELSWKRCPTRSEFIYFMMPLVK